MRYLWPYRVRLGGALLCVLAISVLWGGGLAAVLPTMKILLSSEGLHGWAYNSVADNRLGATIVQRMAPEGVQSPQGQNLALILDIVRVEPAGPADRAGLRANQWLIGLTPAGQGPQVVRGDTLARELWQAGDGGRIDLYVMDQKTREVTSVEVTLGRASTFSRWLARIASAVPEPADMPGRLPMLVWLLVILVVVTLVREVMRFLQEFIVQDTVNRALMDLRCENYNAVLHMPTTFFSQQGVTDTMSRFIQDSNELASGQTTLFGKTLVEPGKMVASLIVALFFSWKLTLLAAVAGPPVFFLIHRFGRIMKKASRRALESWSLMLAVLEETLIGIRVVKAYTMEGGERKRFFRVNRQLLRQQRKMARIDSATAPVVEGLGIMAACAAVGVAGYFVLGGQMDREIFMTWIGALMATFDPVRKLAHVITRFQRADAAAGRIFEMMDRPQEPRVANAPMLPRHNRNLEFRNVRFRYPGAAVDAIAGVNLTIQAGQKVAIVGPNGCGKTTLLSLVPRLADPTEGQILLDGLDVSQHSVRSLRRQIGLVTQETIIFHATIRENVAYGLRRPRDADVLAAARQAFVDEFVRDLPEAYETMVGEHGATLSGGQRQRIAIARAILRDPSILIFDEATSQIDSDSERKIHLAMEEFVKGRTTLMIAHRFATVLSADRIVVMSDGRILDSGTHAELLERCELYRHLYRTQFEASGG
ncbi:MAG TPA: ABC transporter ATP-binding protein [Phycisphaerae bacterium]|nr:ABC transporter ATP-binding protein [Phycisphaerae bacterium]HQL74641.1 ABC transporter ATP-binding protein [Phycisphaerae bacterium]